MDPSILQRITILEQQIASLTLSKLNHLQSKKRVSGYSLFCSTMRDDAKVTLYSTSTHFNHHHVNRELASMWKSLSLEEQRLWNTHASL
jgi:DNA polymerase III psi subunit